MVNVLQFLPPPTGFAAALVNAEVGFVSARAAAIKAPDTEIDAAQLSAHLAARYAGQVLTVGQEIAFEFQVRARGWCAQRDGAHVRLWPPWRHAWRRAGGLARGRGAARRPWLPRRAAPDCAQPHARQNLLLPTRRHQQGINYLLRVGTLMVADPSAEQLAVHRAQLLPDTAYVYETRHGGGLKITGQRAVANTQVRRGAGVGCSRRRRPAARLPFDQGCMPPNPPAHKP